MIHRGRCFATIEADAVSNNFDIIKQASNGKMIMAVIKADAYGHGSVQIAELLRHKADFFAVATAEEALELRGANIDNPLLVMGYVPLDKLLLMAQNDVTITVYDDDYARRQSRFLSSAGTTVKAHIKIDTGMSRLGFCFGKSKKLIEILQLSGFEFDGIYTHFAVADGSCGKSDYTFTKTQHATLMAEREALSTEGYNFRYIHSSNTAGAAFCNFKGDNIARVGIGLYGYSPGIYPIPGLQPALSLKAVVAQVKDLKPGDFVSYGRSYRVSKQMKIGVISCGYADGYPLALSNCGVADVNGLSAPVVGRVCMDQLILDVTAAGRVDVGDVVTLLGKKPADGFDVAAQKADTIVYELLCGISPRVERIYLQ